MKKFSNAQSVLHYIWYNGYEVMYMGRKDLLDINIMEILSRCSSKENKILQKEIMQHLWEDYGIEVSRNTLSQRISELRLCGYIEGKRGVTVRRIFTDSEIDILVNCIMSIKAISEKQTQVMIEKIKDLAEPEKRRQISQSYFWGGGHRTDNEKVGNVMSLISQAIAERKKIKIVYCCYNEKGELNSGKTYIVNPYYIVSEKARLYLLCYAGRKEIEARRIDRIQQVTILKDKRTEIHEIEKYRNHNFSLEDYMQEHIYMYSGESDRIKLKLKKEKIGEFIDWYGKNYRVLEETEDDLIVQVKANVEAVYFWSLQYNDIVEVLAPDSLRKKLYEGAVKMMNKYQPKGE